MDKDVKGHSKSTRERNQLDDQKALSSGSTWHSAKLWPCDLPLYCWKPSLKIGARDLTYPVCQLCVKVLWSLKDHIFLWANICCEGGGHSLSLAALASPIPFGVRNSWLLDCGERLLRHVKFEPAHPGVCTPALGFQKPTACCHGKKLTHSWSTEKLGCEHDRVDWSSLAWTAFQKVFSKAVLAYSNQSNVCKYFCVLTRLWLHHRKIE